MFDDFEVAIGSGSPAGTHALINHASAICSEFTVLHDADGDGKAEVQHVFAAGLGLRTG